MVVDQPSPTLQLLQEEYLLIQAWKKTVTYLRAHNWFADHLAIDRASADLPRFLGELASRLSRPEEYETRPLRLIPAPKSHTWSLTGTEQGEIWKPESTDLDTDTQTTTPKGPPIRPLAHADLQDQVAATAILLCLADRVESIQGDPRGDLSKPAYRQRVVSYGNRLLCDRANRRLAHRWGSASLYRSYFEDYRAFVARPDAVAKGAYTEDANIVIVHSDLKNFYDRVRPDFLSQRLLDLRRANENTPFYQLASRVLHWNWDPRDMSLADGYAQEHSIESFSEIALPQGLVAAGFFSNVALLRFDRRLRRAFYKEVATGVQLLDAARYVDDLRLVLKVTRPSFDLVDVKKAAADWLAERLAPDTDLRISEEKTLAAEYKGDTVPTIVRQRDRMTRIQKAVSGGFDIAGGEAILRAVLEVLQLQARYSRGADEAASGTTVAMTDVPDGTVGRFSASRVRTAYRWLRPLLPAPSPVETGHRSRESRHLRFDALDNPPLRTREELDNFAEALANEWISGWIVDPSNIRTLRIALDIWPSVSTLKRILGYLEPYAECPCESPAKWIALYCLSELLRAGVTETGFVPEPDLVKPDPLAYRAELMAAAKRILSLEDVRLPWYLAQQALLLLAACNASPDKSVSQIAEGGHHAALVTFLHDPASAPSTSDFAIYSILARRSFIPGEAVQLLLPHITKPRLKKIAELDPTLAIELIEEDGQLRELLPEHLQRDLSLPMPSSETPPNLAALVLHAQPEMNPFRDELILLQFALKVLRVLKRATSYTITPSDLDITMPNDDVWKLRAGEFDVTLRKGYKSKTSIYSPPAWCKVDERWRFQLGYLLRFILAGQEEFTASVGSPNWREVKGSTYHPVPLPWKMRRYGLFNAREAFGDRWLPVTDWITTLVLDLLAWPGARRPGFAWVEAGIDDTATELEHRIGEVLRMQGSERSELLLEIDFSPPLASQLRQSMHAVVAQPLLPDSSWFQPGGESLTIAERRRLRSHLATVLSAVRSSLRLHGSYDSAAAELDMLILPELSVHIDDLGMLKRFAVTHRAIVVAGLVYHNVRDGDGQKLVNSAVWLLPEKTHSGGYRVRVIDQGKHQLAPREVEAHLNVRSFRTSQWLVGYRWSADRRRKRFWLTASICYDATNTALTADLTGKSDMYVIAAWNRDLNTFDAIMRDNYRMYQMVVVANHGSFGGSGAYAPYADRHKRKVFQTYGLHQATISHVVIDSLESFVERDNRRGEFKPPPAGWGRNRRVERDVAGK